MQEFFEIIATYGFPTTGLVFMFWQGIPRAIKYIDGKTELHRQEVRELIEAHEQRVDRLIEDYKESNKAITQSLIDLQREVKPMNGILAEWKTQNLSLRDQINRSAELLQRLKDLSEAEMEQKRNS